MSAPSTASQSQYFIIKRGLPEHVPEHGRGDYINRVIIHNLTPSTPAAIRRLLFTSSTAPIHPLFEPVAWGGLEYVEDYIRLSPALVLASRLLTSKRSLRFWHSFMYGPKTLNEATGKQVFHREVFERDMQKNQVQLPPEEADKTRKALEDMIYWMCLEMGELPTPILARRQPSDNPPDPRLSGAKSKIVINKLILDHRGNFDGKSEAEVSQKWFQLGIAIVAEFGHALHKAFHGSDVPEMHFEDQWFVDMGRAWAEWVFGVKNFARYAKEEEIRGFLDWDSWKDDMGGREKDEA